MFLWIQNHKNCEKFALEPGFVDTDIETRGPWEKKKRKKVRIGNNFAKIHSNKIGCFIFKIKI